MSSSSTIAPRATEKLHELANVARCATGARSASLARALARRSSIQVPPELSAHEALSALRSRFTGSSRVCSVDALRTVGVPDEILDLACRETDPVMAGTSECSCGGGCAVDVGFLEDPDNRPYLWDMEDVCR